MKTLMNEMLKTIPNSVDFELDNDSKYELVIYDVYGKVLRNYQKKTERRGIHSIKWDGLDDKGKEVDRGIYYYKMIINNELVLNNMVLIK